MSIFRDDISADFSEVLSQSIHERLIELESSASSIEGLWTGSSEGFISRESDVQVTGSLFVSGTEGHISASSISASTYFGDGSNLTGIVGGFWTASNGAISRFSDVLISGSLFVSSSLSASEINWDGGTANLTAFSSSTHDRLVNLENNLAVTGAFWTASGDFIRRQSDLHITGTLRVSSDISASAVSASTYYGDGSNLTGIVGGFWTASAGFIDRLSDVLISGSFRVSSSVGGADALIISTSGDMFVSGTVSASAFIGDGSGLTGLAGGLWTASGDFIRRQSDVEITGSLSISSTITASAYLGFEESLPILISGSFFDTIIPPIYVPTSMSFVEVQFALETGSCFIHVEASGSTSGSLATGSITTQLPWGTISRITESVNRADAIVLKVSESKSSEHLSINLIFTRAS